MDYYDDSEPMPEGGSAQGDMEKSQDSGKTALIDASICPGAKVGEIIPVRVEKVLDSGEYSVSYKPDKGEEMEPQSEMESEAMIESDGVGSYMG